MWSLYGILLLIVINLIRAGMGYYLSITGPTLLYLTELVGTEVKYFSAVFSAAFAGCMVGGLLVGIVTHKTEGKVNPLYLMAGCLLVKALSIMFVPWIHEFWLMFLLMTLGGITFGYLDAGLQALILRLWGATTSRPLIYLYHFTIGIGGLVAPLIAEPFLLEAYGKQEDSEPGCPRITNSSSDNNASDASSVDSRNSLEFSPVGWTYIFIGIYYLFFVVTMAIMSKMRFDKKVGENLHTSGLQVESRPEEPFGDIVWVVLPIMGYYFCSVSSEILFNNFIYSVSVCSKLNFTVSQASMITSVHWIGFFVGRGSGIIASSYTYPSYIASFSLAGTMAMMFVFILFGNSSDWVTWFVSCAHGFFVGPIYPAGVTWMSNVTNVSGKYMFIFVISGTAGCVAVLPIGGLMFQNDPFSVMYLGTAISCFSAVFFALALLAARRRNRRKPSLDDVKNDDEELKTLQPNIKS